MSSESDMLGMAFAADRERDRREARMDKSVRDLIEALERLAELARGIALTIDTPQSQRFLDAIDKANLALVAYWLGVSKEALGTANAKPTAQEATPEANKKQQIETAIRNLRNATEVLAAYCGVKL